MSIEIPMEGTHTEDQFYASVVKKIEMEPDAYCQAFDMVVKMAQIDCPATEMLVAFAWIGVIFLRDDGDRMMRLRDHEML